MEPPTVGGFTYGKRHRCLFSISSENAVWALKYKTQTSRQSPHLIQLFFVWLIKYWYILNISHFEIYQKRSLGYSKSLINIAWSHFLHAQESLTLYWAMNYGSTPIITMPAYTLILLDRTSLAKPARLNPDLARPRMSGLLPHRVNFQSPTLISTGRANPCICEWCTHSGI